MTLSAVISAAAAAAAAAITKYQHFSPFVACTILFSVGLFLRLILFYVRWNTDVVGSIPIKHQLLFQILSYMF